MESQPEKKEEVKKVVPEVKDAKEIKEPHEYKEEDYNVDPPELPEAKYKQIFPQIYHSRSLINVLSYIDKHALTRVARLNRYAFKFITNEDNAVKIEAWELNEEEQKKIDNIVKGFFEDIQDKESS